MNSNKVKKYREDRIWTKAKLARESEVSVGTITRMEDGLPTRKDRRLAVAKALGQSHSLLFPNDKD